MNMLRVYSILFLSEKKLDYLLNQPFFFVLIAGEVLILGTSSVLPFMIIKGTKPHKAKNNIQNK